MNAQEREDARRAAEQRDRARRIRQWELDTGDDYDEIQADHEATMRSIRSSGE